MKIQIIHRACGGTEFLPQPSRLHLGAQNAEGVDRLQFQLPESWADCAIALYLRRSDGTQLAPVPLDGDACVTVDRRLTGCTGGQWMLAAVSGSGYTAYTRPGRYDTYATLPTDGGSEDLPPTLYEQFVARVLESASTAATAAQSASASAERCTSSAAQAQTAARQASTSSTAAAGCASRAEAAAARAEELAPADGQVLSVNGKSGVVVLRAQDVGALPRPAQPAAGSLLRVLSVNPDTGALLTDTTPPPDLTPYVRSSTLPDAKTPGPVRIDPQYGVAVREDATLTLVPASAEQLDSMTDGFAPLTPALLPYGVKKALTTASTAAGWTGAEKTAALRTLGADLTAYYTSYFKTGKPPKIERDAIYWFHRRQHTDAPYDKTQQTRGPFRIVGTPHNEIELLGFLKAPGTLRITLNGKVHEQAFPAGMHSFKIPLECGRPEFSLIRDGRELIRLTGHQEIVRSNPYQDMLYYADGGTAEAPRIWTGPEKKTVAPELGKLIRQVSFPGFPLVSGKGGKPREVGFGGSFRIPDESEAVFHVRRMDVKADHGWVALFLSAATADGRSRFNLTPRTAKQTYISGSHPGTPFRVVRDNFQVEYPAIYRLRRTGGKLQFLYGNYVVAKVDEKEYGKLDRPSISISAEKPEDGGLLEFSAIELRRLP